MSFSKKYRTYIDWRKAQTATSEYVKKIDRLHALYPKASLNQLRGHPTKNQTPISKLKKKNGTLPPLDSFTENKIDKYERSLEALKYMRRDGLSLTEASKMVHLSPDTIKHMVGNAIYYDGRQYVAKPSDRCERIMTFYDERGRIIIRIKSSKTASLIGQYHAAIKKYTQTGNFSDLLNFQRKSIKDAYGNQYEFITDLKQLDEFIRSGEVRFESIYQFTT